MKTKITVLCENSVLMPFPLIGEHGLSFLIETDDATLFDTGQGIGLLNNMKVMGKDPADIRRIIISHGHYDHTGGMLAFLRARSEPTQVYLHQSAFNEKLALIPAGAGCVEVAIGMRASREEYESAGAAFSHVSGFQKITGTIFALADVRRPEGWKAWDGALKQRAGSDVTDDPFDDDLSLLLETESGPVVLLGCAHAGIVEILHDISERTGYRKFHAVIGGTHLDSAPAEYVDRAVDTIRKFDVKKIAVSHCTGFRVACRFASEFRDEFAGASVGAVFEF